MAGRSAVLSFADGYSLVELLIVVTTLAVAGAIGVPSLVAAADAADGAAATRYLTAVIARARSDAARRQATVALRFDGPGDDPAFAVVVDGDGDGVSPADVASGIDWVARPADRLSAHFSRARLGIAAAAPGIEGGAPIAPADDPVQVGVLRQLSVTAIGTATSGTLYVRSRRGAQFAVRIGGVTGRARALRFVPGLATWQPL